ncbi:tetratricopeptide repeat protein [Nodosilinea sp. LEGE 07298]|uniref:tetratricopeptide repeat protein n=1 Tax=Nodosilinea sp. LEGE 07298 TaxID=2777970 RepID=UPI00187DDF2F|nr:tetratricopeptide repeat protein [Nodosilinea sp. LEGE 07298]MBE9113475.1 tetratricopeptide repeat protein [Nodosilinea sp. LEGE 07298]
MARFSWGIPFVIRQAAVMWREGKPIEEIVAPASAPALGSGVSAYDLVITTTSERFLVHCFGAPEQEADLEAIYALALMRRPNAELLRQMLDETDLEARLQGLKERYGFILVEQLRLDEKLTQFLRAYLLADLHRTSQRVQTLNDRAIAWLELQVEDKARGIADTAEKLEEDALAETLLDLTHHQFWRSEDAGMQYLVPRFVEGWQYDRYWTRSLLEIAESFQPYMGQDSQKRVSRFEKVLSFNPDFDDVNDVLTDVEKLQQRGRLADGNQAEQDTILWLQKGQLVYRQERYADALECYLTAEKHLTANFNQLRKDLAQGFYRVSGKFIWPGGRDDAVYSAEGEHAIKHALALDIEQSDYYCRFAVICALSGETEKAIAAFHQAIALDPKYAYSHHGLGNVYSVQGCYDEAIAAFHHAIALNPKYASPHHGLGDVYWAQGCYDEAIAAFHQAISLDPNGGDFNSLGWLYVVTKDYENAKKALERAIEDVGWASLFNYGLLWALQKNWEMAQENWQKGYQLCQEDDSPEAEAFYCIALGDADKGLADLKTLLDQELITLWSKRTLLLVAQVMQRCPEFEETAKQAADMLESSLP